MIRPYSQQFSFIVRPGVYVRLRYLVHTGKGQITVTDRPGRQAFDHIAQEILPYRIAWALAEDAAKEVAA